MRVDRGAVDGISEGEAVYVVNEGVERVRSSRERWVLGSHRYWAAIARALSKANDDFERKVTVGHDVYPARISAGAYRSNSSTRVHTRLPTKQ